MAPDKYHYVVNALNNIPSLPGIGISASVLSVMSVGAANILIQATTPAVDISWIEHLTLEGALVVAVGVLWRALSAKDAQLVESTRVVTGALAASATSNAELRKIIEASDAATHKLTESLILLQTRLESEDRPIRKTTTA